MRLSEAEWEKLRDVFAAHALVGLLQVTVDADHEAIAKEAYEIADAMLAVRGNHA